MRLKLYFICIVAGLLLGLQFEASAQVTPATVQDIQALLQEKQSRTPAQQKIDSRLLQAVRESRGQPMAPGVRLEPAQVNADSGGSLNVDITAIVSSGLIKKIEALGGRIVNSFPQYNSIRVFINFTMVETIAGFPEVKFIQPAVKSMTVGTPTMKPVIEKKGGNLPSAALNKFDINYNNRRRPSFAERAGRIRKQLLHYLSTKGNPNTTLFTGTINSQGDRTHRADDTRHTYGFEGQDIRIGVLSDSYNSLGGEAADIISGNLPGVGNPIGNSTPVTVLSDITGGSDEGRAMLQIVHDLAPKAQLFFATANLGEAAFASNIQSLRNAPNNCDIIIDDVFYFDEPVFQDGIIAQAVNTVTAGGALYFSSAGNEGSVAKGSAGYFEGDFNDTGSPVFTFPGGAKAGTIHNFGTVGSPLNGDIITTAGFAYTLNWSDPSGASSNDYDLFLVNSGGSVRASSTNIQSGLANPFEQITPPVLAAGDRLLVFKTAAAQVRAFSINTLRGRLTIVTTGQTHGHSSALNAFSVAAAPAAGPIGAGNPTGPFPSAFSVASQVEVFSSDGPRRMFYNSDGSAITPGNVLIGTNGGTIRNKPDITAADGVSTTLSSSSGLNPFFGTSAAAPHAGAIAALLKSANPTLTVAQIRTLLTTTSLDVESPGYDNISGFGIIQAFQAMQALNPTPVSNITGTGTPVITEAGNNNGNGFIDPGESGNVVVPLTNSSLVAASNVNASLVTTTGGVTITQGLAAYGTIAPGGTLSNSGTPFSFKVAAAVPCGTVINFGDAVTFGGGGPSPQGFVFSKVIGNQPFTGITSNLGAVPPTGPGFTSVTGFQTGRLNRNAPVSTCDSQKITPILAAPTGLRAYDAYTFTNTNVTSQCVTATMTAANGSTMYLVAYNHNGFIPATPNVNFLADQGSSASTQSFAFNVPGGQTFTMVVHEVTPGGSVGSVYNLNVSLSFCASAPLPVTWLSFNAIQKNKQTLLQWKVANELNVSRYEVEYSVDGTNFTTLHSIPATVNTSAEKTYEWQHAIPVAGNNYYRIRQVDMDRHYSVSKVVMIRIDNANSITITPNPASSYVIIHSSLLVNRVQLYSATGQLLVNAVPARNSYSLKLDQLPAGQYILRVETNNEIINKKIIKE